jgi:Xaa-Pro aminopeptidase/L-ascorbate metabolism protein UlaG (beta-lactamase superfamily)
MPRRRPIGRSLSLAGPTSVSVALVVAALLGATLSGQATPLSITALANEGFLLRSAEQAVLIDAFLAEPASLYAGLQPEALAQLLEAKAPFDEVDLALVSHRHLDHVQPDPACAFLNASPETLLVTSPQVLALLREQTPTLAGVAQLPEPGARTTLEHAGIEVEFLRLSHGTGRFADIQNLGHIITVGGQRVLHIGDAAIEPRNFAPYDLPSRALDVALIPYWYFMHPAGRALIDEHLVARQRIACHVPPEELADVRDRLAAIDPGILLSANDMQSWTIPPAARSEDEDEAAWLAVEARVEQRLAMDPVRVSLQGEAIRLQLEFHGDLELPDGTELAWNPTRRRPYVRAALRWLEALRGVRGSDHHDLTLHFVGLFFEFGNGFATPMYESLREIEGRWLPTEGLIGISTTLYEQDVRDLPDVRKEIHDNALHEIGHVLGIGSLWNLGIWDGELEAFAVQDLEQDPPDEILRQWVRASPEHAGLIYRQPAAVAAFQRVHDTDLDIVPISSDSGHLFALFDDEQPRATTSGVPIPATEDELMSHRDVLSAISVGFLTDLGWDMDEAGADPLPRVSPDEPRVLPMRRRAEIRDAWLTRRLDTLVPRLMRQHDIDMWVLVAREYNEDPVLETMLPATWLAARRRTMLVFFDRGPERGVERLSVSRYAVGIGLFPSAWEPESQPDQWARLAEIIAERNPRKIALNSSRDFAHADGLSASERDALLDALAKDMATRVVSAEALAVGWLETRIPGEREQYRELCRLAHEIIATGLSTAAVEPGVTTTADLEWWFRDHIRALGLVTWFHPSVSAQNAAGLAHTGTYAAEPGPTTIQRGDLLHVDFGISYLGLHTDTQRHAYVLRKGETAAPADLTAALAVGNQLQDILIAEFVEGRTGNEILAAALGRARAAGIQAKIYTHPLGFHGHGAGPTIGMWDQQDGVPGPGDVALHPDTVFSIELGATVPVPAWGSDVQIMLEEDVFFDGRQVSWLDGRQTQCILIGF